MIYKAWISKCAIVRFLQIGSCIHAINSCVVWTGVLIAFIHEFGVCVCGCGCMCLLSVPTLRLLSLLTSNKSVFTKVLFSSVFVWHLLWMVMTLVIISCIVRAFQRRTLCTSCSFNKRRCFNVKFCNENFPNYIT